MNNTVPYKQLLHFRLLTSPEIYSVCSHGLVSVMMDTLQRYVTKRKKPRDSLRDMKINESIKNAMLIKGGKENAILTQVLRNV